MSTEVSSNNVTEQSSSNSTLIATNVIGSVKWFNNRFGYGFLVATGDNSSYGDVFVHHSELKISDPNIYKFLTQGEYVQFNIVKTTGGKHEFQAGSVTGVNGGKLLCENSPSTYRRGPPRNSSEEDNGRRPQSQSQSHSGENYTRRSQSDSARPTTGRTQRRSQDPDGFTMPRSKTPRETPYKTAVNREGNKK